MGKPELFRSADPHFRRDAGLHNPKDLLLAAVASCPMLTYLALCARTGIRVALGQAGVSVEGGGAFVVDGRLILVVDDVERGKRVSAAWARERRRSEPP